MSLKPLLERIGWEKGLRPFLFKQLSPKTGWSATLGSLCVMLFAILVVTGVFLAMYYNPSPDKAYQSVDYIMNDVPLGSLLRGIHHWAASAMVVAVFLHLMTNFFSGTFKRPRELTWIGGVCLLLITLGLGFTGYLLPWDMKAFWATVVSTNIPKDLPVVGKFITRLALGGENVSGSTLTRFYAIHAMLLPALLAAFAAFHIYLVRIHGMAEHSEIADSKKSISADKPGTEPPPQSGGRETQPSSAEGLYRFYPEHTWRSTLVFMAVFVVLIALSIFGHIPREPIAGTLVESYLPRPEWYYMWLFQLLTYFPGNWEAVGSLVFPIIGLALLFALPFLDRRRATGVANRPLALAAGVTAIMGIAYLTIMGFAGARPYGQTIPVPARPLSATETRGVFLYADRECAYCHQIDGQGGHRVGPDLANIIGQHRTKDYLVRYLKNPQAIATTSIMPKYELPDADLQALADFMLSLDFGKYPKKTLSRAEALGQKGE